MIVRLRPERPFPFRWWRARAYTVHEDGGRAALILYDQDAPLPDFETLIWHELEHALDHAFVNETHHPWWHWCIRAKVPIRLPYHASKGTRWLVQALIRDGRLDLKEAL